jgi:hypothetical protein
MTRAARTAFATHFGGGSMKYLRTARNTLPKLVRTLPSGGPFGEEPVNQAALDTVFAEWGSSGGPFREGARQPGPREAETAPDSGLQESRA